MTWAGVWQFARLVGPLLLAAWQAYERWRATADAQARAGAVLGDDAARFADELHIAITARAARRRGE